MKIVSYSLFENHPRYCVNACINSDLCAKYYPNWECRIYYDNSVPSKVINELTKKTNTRLIHNTKTIGKEHARRMWRFFAYDDCSVFLSRDIDSYITEREASAVSEWINSDKNLHIIRDHPHHTNKIQAGMFGIKKTNSLLNMKSMCNSFITTSNNYYSMDEKFLSNNIYPLFDKDMVVHDDTNIMNDKTHEWKSPILDGQCVGLAQYPASIHQDLFSYYERLIR